MTPEAKLDELETTAKAALEFHPEPPSGGWEDEPEVAPAWDATSGWLEDGGHAAFARNHEYSDEQESDGAEVDAAFIKAADPATVLSLVAEVRAWRALALGIADKGSAIDCLRAEPDGCVFLFVGEHQSTNAPPGEAAIDLAKQLGWKEST